MHVAEIVTEELMLFIVLICYDGNIMSVKLI